MSDFIISHLGSIGLILDMIGVSILFFVVVTVGEQVVRVDQDEENLRLRTKTRKEIYLKVGYALVFLGFVLQLVSNELKSKSNSIAQNNDKTEKISNVNRLKDYRQFIKGHWYLNKWTTYHTLIFSDSSVFVDNNVDTVFTLNIFGFR